MWILAISMNPTRDVTLKIGALRLTWRGGGTKSISTSRWWTVRPVDWTGLAGEVRSLDELKLAWKKRRMGSSRRQISDFAATGLEGENSKSDRVFPHYSARREMVAGRSWVSVLLNRTELRALPPIRRVAGREKLFERLPPGSSATTDSIAPNAGLRYGEQDFRGNWKAKLSRV